MKDQLNKAMEQFLIILKDAKDLAYEEMPHLIQEILWYESVEHSIFAAITVILGLVLGYYVYTKAKKFNDPDIPNDQEHWNPIEGISGVVSVPVSFLLFALFIKNLLIVLKIYIAPRLFLIEYIRKFIE